MTGVPLDDRGLLLGDGLFETILALAGRPVAMEAHLDRLMAGCRSLGLPQPDRDQARRLCLEALQGLPQPESRAAIRLTLTAGSGGRGLDRPAQVHLRLLARVAPAPRPEGPARLRLSSVRRNEGSPVSRLKSLSYLDNVLARHQAAPDEALMLNNRGDLACAGAANLFWLSGRRLYTPALDCGLLPGIVRAQVLALAGHLGLEAREVHAEPQVLAAADGVFLTNSLIGVRPVVGLDRQTFPQSDLVSRLAAEIDGLNSSS